MLPINLLNGLNFALLIWWSFLRWKMLDPKDVPLDIPHIVTAAAMIIFLCLSSGLINVSRNDWNTYIYYAAMLIATILLFYLMYRVNTYFDNEIKHIAAGDGLKWYIYLGLDLLNATALIGFWLYLVFSTIRVEYHSIAYAV